ncbi:MAG: xanthine dehydrogenase family protein molybdopterin-binding subunit [Deltaproteobacteria bacterium]|nr:xanthine dehydrogenase family protein molybdopterin-binding subunit [Deltaproteobacteria bacterium]MBW2362830.1 xanthine dehydrogenase family protein molybdopterin-binding subunit [Deltaproteobacteria bacterium]
MKLVGTSVRRREDPRLLSGQGTFVDDIRLADMLHMRVLRSAEAHARIRSMDTSAALALPDVVTVVTGQDAPQLAPPLPTMSAAIPDLKVPAHHVLAVEKVCFAGEGVAAVVASDPYVACDALDRIVVEYEPLPALVDPEKAMEPDAPVLHEALGDNIAYRLRLGDDVDDALRRSDLVVCQRMENPRVIPNSMETRGIVAHYQPAEGKLTTWVGTQVPHILRGHLARMLGLPENRVRVVAPDVGGAFGTKANVYAEEVLAAALSMRLGRPVKWIEDRLEHMLATTHGRGQGATLEAGVNRDGTLTALRVHITADLGAYLQMLTHVIPTLTATNMTGCYQVPACQVEVLGVFTNKTPTDAYRGAGRPEATYYLERLMDLVAGRLDLDPAVVRRRNFVRPEQFPYATATGPVYDTGDYDLTFDRALEKLDYERLRDEQERLRGEGRYLGVGFSTWVEQCSFGPTAHMVPGFAPGGWEVATVRVEPSGTVTVLTGTSPHGQGVETTFSQLVVDELGVPIGDIRVIHGDTDAVPYGIGTMSARSMAVGGSALLLCLRKLKEKAKRIAADRLETDAESLLFEEGRICLRDSPERGMSFPEVVALAYGGGWPAGVEPGLEATSTFDPPDFTYPFGAHICVVEVGASTGAVELLRYIAVDDCGRVINPLIVEGQVQGGIAQGVGQALLEEAVYSEDAQLLTGTFMDYLMPTCTLLPAIEMDRTETLTPVNPLGAKGVGESGALAAPPAVVNAVMDALSPLGIRHIDMPLTPEKVWRAMQQAAPGGD